jgi:hypothetical protein
LVNRKRSALQCAQRWNNADEAITASCIQQDNK